MIRIFIFWLVQFNFKSIAYINEKTNINFKNFEEPFLYNQWKINYFNSFFISFGYIINEKNNDIILLSFTNFYDIDIIIKIKHSDNKIYINDILTNLDYSANNNFIYIEGFFQNTKINLSLLDKNNNNYDFIYPDIINELNFKLFYFILGGKKDFTNVGFKGIFYNIFSGVRIVPNNATNQIIINPNPNNEDIEGDQFTTNSEQYFTIFNFQSYTTTNSYKVFINYNSHILILIEFSKIFGKTGYFPNTIENGFIGLFNGNSISDDIHDLEIQIHRQGNNYYSKVIFSSYRSYLKIPNQFVEYINNLNVKTYTIYASLKFLLPINRNFLCFNHDFYLYKRNNLFFIFRSYYSDNNRIIFTLWKNSINSAYESYLMSNLNSGLETKFLYFISIIDLFNNNYKIQFNLNYEYSGNNHYRRVFNENHIFSTTNEHFIGFKQNFTCNNTMNLYRIEIYEWYLVEGVLLYGNNKLYSLGVNNNKIYIECYNNSNVLVNFFLSRVGNYKECINFGSKMYVLENNCLIYGNSICLRCYEGYYLNNNICSVITSTTTNNDKFPYYECTERIDNNYSRNFNFNLPFSNNSVIQFYKIKINTQHLAYYIRFITTINTNDDIRIFSNFPGINEFNLDGKFFSQNSVSFNIRSDWQTFKYELIYCNYKDDSYIFPLENCDNLLGSNSNNLKLIINDYGLFKCIQENNIPNGFYINNDLILKCNKNCKKCTSNINCLECNENYILRNNFCFKKNENCLDQNNINYCNDCLPNIIKFEITTNNFLCLGNCSINCSSCISALYNNCLTCKPNNLYYPQLKECRTQTQCDNNYDFVNDGTDCLNICKSRDTLNICISCIDNYYIKQENNQCVKCLSSNSEFLNNNNLDIEGRPKCESCENSCLTCVDKFNKCLSCNTNKKFLEIENKCLENCPIGYYTLNNICHKCLGNCLNCTQNSCSSCMEGFYILNDKCVENCPNNYYIDSNNNCNLCSTQIDNCETCKKKDSILKCDKCIENFYLKQDQSCSLCTDLGYYKNKNECSKCKISCSSCEIESYNCLACNSGYFSTKIWNYTSCIKNCESNFYFNNENNKCEDCNSCQYCYKNKKLICKNCEQCKNLCNLDLIFMKNGLSILDNSNNINFNSNYKINKWIYNNITNIEKGLLYEFKNENLVKLNINLDLNLIYSSKNCFDIKKDFTIYRKKDNCKIISTNTYENNIIKISNNFLLKKGFKLNVFIKNTKRAANYTIFNNTDLNKLYSETYFNVSANNFKNNTDIELIIDRNYWNEKSYCSYNNTITTNFTIKTDSNNYQSDFSKIEESLNKVYLDPTIFNKTQVENASEVVKNTVKTSFNSFILFSSFTGSITIISKWLQLVYIVDFMTLLPINLGVKVNTFLKYFKINLSIDINLNSFFQIKTSKITNYYIYKRSINPKLLELDWINITVITIETFIIFILYFFVYLSKIVNYILKLEDSNKLKNKKFFNLKEKKKNYLKKIKIKVEKVNKNKKKIKSKKVNIKEKLKNKKVHLKFHEKYETSIQVFIFNLIEGLRPNLLGIVLVYSFSIKNFDWNIENLEIISLFIFNFFLISKYFWDLFNIVLYNNKKNYQSKYYKSIVYYNLNERKINLYHQLVASLRDFLLIVVILNISYKINIHSIIIAIIQLLFVIFLFFIKSSNKKWDIYKVRFEESCNFFLIITLTFNHYLFVSDIFEYSFIVIYLLLFSYKLIEILISFLQIIFDVLKFLFKKILSIFFNK